MLCLVRPSLSPIIFTYIIFAHDIGTLLVYKLIKFYAAENAQILVRLGVVLRRHHMHNYNNTSYVL